MGNPHFFQWNDWLGVSSATYILVRGPDGHPAPTPKSEFENIDIRRPDGTLEKNINPYQYDPRDVNPAIIEAGLGADGNPIHLLRLRPGQAISTSYSTLNPTRREVIPVARGSYYGQAVTDAPVNIEHPEKLFAVPPPGFRHLKEFDLRKPGRYAAQLVVNDILFVDRYEDPKRPFWNKLRPWIYTFAEGSPGGDYQKPINVVVESSPVEFEVPR